MITSRVMSSYIDSFVLTSYDLLGKCLFAITRALEMELFNDSLLTKQCWRLKQNTEYSLLYQILHMELDLDKQMGNNEAYRENWLITSLPDNAQ
ncbi:hypothetical protein VNO77_36716 [Canavalia gladiata]|uniref:Uncharacterized protein n=1 Tax=Canavalia gladiata TaxID=3824 RepID=A0AAN9KAQ9_CANGL